MDIQKKVGRKNRITMFQINSGSKRSGPKGESERTINTLG